MSKSGNHCACHADELGKPFLDTVAGIVEKLRSTKHTTQGEAEHGACSCEMPKTVGPVAWAVFHGAAQALHDDVCQNCGKHAVRMIRGLHDMVNVKLGKPVRYPADLRFLQKMANEAVGNMGEDSMIAVADPGSLTESVKALPWDSNREKVFAVYLEKPGGKVLAARELSVGDRRTASVPIDKLIQDGKALGAKAAVMVHNHPSGNPNPSVEDMAVTTQTRRDARRHGLTLTDHLIVAGDQVTSLVGRN